MKISRLLLCSILSVFLFGSCSKDDNEPYTLKFVHIMDNDASSVTVSAQANLVSTYNVYLSAQQILAPVKVTYKIVAGNGLVEGVDYEMITKGTEISFVPGIYDMPVRIRWMANPVDPSKNNTIRIDLVSVSDPAYTIGLPGKDKNQSSLTITKIP